MATDGRAYGAEGPGASAAPDAGDDADCHGDTPTMLGDRSGQMGIDDVDTPLGQWWVRCEATLAGGAVVWDDVDAAMEPLVSGGGTDEKDEITGIGVEGPHY